MALEKFAACEEMIRPFEHHLRCAGWQPLRSGLPVGSKVYPAIACRPSRPLRRCILVVWAECIDDLSIECHVILMPILRFIHSTASLSVNSVIPSMLMNSSHIPATAFV